MVSAMNQTSPFSLRHLSFACSWTTPSCRAAPYLPCITSHQANCPTGMQPIEETMESHFHSQRDTKVSPRRKLEQYLPPNNTPEELDETTTMLPHTLDQTLVRLPKEQEEQDHLLPFEQIRQNLFQIPSPATTKPSHQVYQAFQSLLARPDDGAFNAEMWWVVDRQYRPKLERGATPLVVRCMRLQGWSESYARRVLAGYRQFLSLKRAMEDWEGRVLEPSKDIHRLWQQHMLDVINYSYDCVLLCGKVLEHRPDDEELLEERRQRRWITKQVLENVFSDVDIEVWHDILTTGPLHLPEYKEDNDKQREEDDAVIVTKDDERKEKALTVKASTTPKVESGSPRRGGSPRKTPMTRQERRERFRRRMAATTPQKARQHSPSKPSQRSSHVPLRQKEGTHARPPPLLVPSPVESNFRPLSPSSNHRYQSPRPSRATTRPSTPVAERPYDDPTLSPNPPPRLHRLLEESRVDAPTPRTANAPEVTTRLEYEIETDWGVVKSFELVPEHPVEDDPEIDHGNNDDMAEDPIYSRRLCYERSDYESRDRYSYTAVSPPSSIRGNNMSPSARSRDISPSYRETFPQFSDKRFSVVQPEAEEIKEVEEHISPVASATAAASSPPKTTKSDRKKTMTIHFRNVQTMDVVPTRVRSTMKLGRMFQAYASAQNLPLVYLHFFWHGKAVRSTDTPSSLGLRDRDKIDVWNSLTASVSLPQGTSLRE